MTIPNAKFELTMSKKFLVALATSLVLANGTSTAFASSGSNSDNSGSSTTLPAARNNKNLTSEQKAAQKKLEQDVFKAELRTYLLKRAEIEKTFKNDMANAGKSFNIALKSANTFAARKVARDAFVTAGNLARQIYQNALNELGAPPAKPGKP